MKLLLSEPWPAGKGISKFVETPAVREAASRMREIVGGDCTGTAMLCMLDSRGVGKRSVLINAAASCGFLHLHVVLREFESIVGVANRLREFWPAETGAHMSREEVMSEFIDLFEKDQLGLLFDSCRVALRIHATAGGSILQMESIHVLPLESASELSETASAAWDALLISMDEMSLPTIVIHVDGVESIYTGVEYPERRDLRGCSSEMFSRRDAHALALGAFVQSIGPYASGVERRIVWSLTGTRSNLQPCLDVPQARWVLDLTKHLRYWSPEVVFRVFRNHAAIGVASYKEADARMKYCMARLAGPPIVVEFFFEALHARLVRDRDDMYAKWTVVEEYIEKRMQLFLPKLASASEEDLRRCCLEPMLERLVTFQFWLTRSMVSNRWSDLVQGGLVRLVPGFPKNFMFDMPY